MSVHSEDAEIAFYREILGFRPYWSGGMKQDRVDWVSQQVPDGHDWLESMRVRCRWVHRRRRRTVWVLNHLSMAW